MSPEDIHKDVIKEWSLVFHEIGILSLYDENFRKTLAGIECQAEMDVTKYLQPWVQILEDEIQWLSNLASIFDDFNHTRKLSRAQKSIWVLIGTSCAYAVAVRRLALSGLDTPAKAAARSLDEHLCACLAFLNDRDLAEEFQKSQLDKEAADFWYRNLSSKAIRKHLNSIERKIGLNQEASMQIRAWRDENIDLFCQAVHPSYVFAALTSVSINADDPHNYGPAYLGRATAFSERTLEFCCKTIWYFISFGFALLVNDEEFKSNLMQMPKDDERPRLVVIGRDAIQRVVLKYWNHKSYPDHKY